MNRLIKTRRGERKREFDVEGLIAENFSSSLITTILKSVVNNVYKREWPRKQLISDQDAVKKGNEHKRGHKRKKSDLCIQVKQCLSRRKDKKPESFFSINRKSFD